MIYSRTVRLGKDTFTIQDEDYLLLSLVAERISEMNKICGGKGTFRKRVAQKKKGAKETPVDYFEMVTDVPKLSFDDSEYKTTYIKMRVSKETDETIPGWPYFIFRTQRWNFHDPNKGVDYFFDPSSGKNGEWKKGEYDADTATWKEVK